jgi:hypothetical protein
MEHLAELDTSENMSQSASNSNTNPNTTTKASAGKMDSKKSDSTGTAKDDSLTCYICSQVGHISRNCLNRNLMKKLLEQALVNRDAPKAKSGRLHKDMKKGCAPTGRKESGWLAEEKDDKQETDSEMESELENLSNSDSEVGKVKGGQ